MPALAGLADVWCPQMLERKFFQGFKSDSPIRFNEWGRSPETGWYRLVYYLFRCVLSIACVPLFGEFPR